jgi:transposase
VLKRRGKMRAQIAAARRLAVIMHRMWLDGTDFRWATGAGCARRCPGLS